MINISMETIMIGLLLFIVGLQLILLWRTHITVRILKKQIKKVELENEMKKEIDKGDDISVDIRQTEDIVLTKQQNKTSSSNIEEYISNSVEVNCSQVENVTGQNIVKGIVQEKEELINEILSEIFG